MAYPIEGLAHVHEYNPAILALVHTPHSSSSGLLRELTNPYRSALFGRRIARLGESEAQRDLEGTESIARRRNWCPAAKPVQVNEITAVVPEKGASTYFSERNSG